MSRKKSTQLKAWVTPEQKREWLRAAYAMQRSFSDWIRVTLDNAASEVNADPKHNAKKKGRSNVKR